eukprot:15447675-Alexandrium_andersonii.AAC.2
MPFDPRAVWRSAPAVGAVRCAVKVLCGGACSVRVHHELFRCLLRSAGPEYHRMPHAMPHQGTKFGASA